MVYYKDPFEKKACEERRKRRQRKRTVSGTANTIITVMGLTLAVIIIVNAKLRHDVAATATTIVEFLYGNMSIVEKIVDLACDFLIGRLSTSDSESSACPQSHRK